MPLLAVLWLALLHLLAAAPAPRLAGAVAAAWGTSQDAHATPSLRERPAPHDEAIRAPRPLPALGALRSAAPRPPAPPPHGLAPALGRHDTVATGADSRTARQPSHAPAARGVLPYFPTAPPRQG